MDPQEGTEIPEGSVEPTEGDNPSVGTDTSSEAPGPAETAGASPAATGINPAWVGLRDAIGEDHFETFARPILTEMDQAASTRITSLNQQLKGYEGFQPLVEKGASAEDLQQAYEVAQLLESNPEQLYDFLAEHLGKNGAAEESEEGYEDEEGSYDLDSLPPEFRQQLEQMQQFQQQMQEQQQQQEYAQQVSQFEAQLEQEGLQYIENNPTWTADDLPELEEIRMQLTQQLQQQGHQRIASLDEASKVLQERVSRYQKRMGPAAPNTLPTTAGGNAVSPQGFDASKASKTDFINQIANDLQGLKA